MCRTTVAGTILAALRRNGRLVGFIFVTLVSLCCFCLGFHRLTVMVISVIIVVMCERSGVEQY